MNYVKIGVFIAQKRKEVNLTQKELGEKLKVTDKAVSKWERGLGCPDVSLLGELSGILNVGIGEILNGESNDELKNNSEFIKKAINCSKIITEDNIFDRIKKILIAILVIIVLYISFIGIKQFIYIKNLSDLYNKENTTFNIDNLKQEVDKFKVKVDIINNNKYFDKFDALYDLSNVIINDFNDNIFLSNEIRYSDICKFDNIISILYDFSGVLSRSMINENLHFLITKRNIELSEISLECHNLYNYNANAQNGYENLYYYREIKKYNKNAEIQKLNNNYNILENILSEINSLLDLIIKEGEKNA